MNTSRFPSTRTPLRTESVSVHCPFPGTPSTVPGLEKGHSSWQWSRAALAGKHTGYMAGSQCQVHLWVTRLSHSWSSHPTCQQLLQEEALDPKLGWEWESAVPSGTVSSFRRGRHREVAYLLLCLACLGVMATAFWDPGARLVMKPVWGCWRGGWKEPVSPTR